jgi:hypothetical protein
MVALGREWALTVRSGTVSFDAVAYGYPSDKYTCG